MGKRSATPRQHRRQIGYPALWRAIDGAVRDAVAPHPDIQIAVKRRALIVKPAGGAVLALQGARAGQPAKTVAGLPILDRFGGSGTAALVAAAFGFDCTLIEINPGYIALARRRLASAMVKMDRPADPGAAKPSKDARQGVLS